MELNAHAKLSGLARRLVDKGLLTPEQAQQAQETANTEHRSLIDQLVNHDGIDATQVAEHAATEFGMPMFDPGTLDPDQMPVKDISEKLLRKHHALPVFKRGRRLYLGIASPTNLSALDEIKFNTGLNTEGVIVPADQIDPLLDEALQSAETSGMDDLLDDDLDNLDLQTVDEDEGPDISESDIDDAPVVRFVNKVLLDAINKKASDIHFEPYEKNFRVRFRVDGILKEMSAPPRGLAERIIARLKVMSRMDISERRIPQDGRIKLALSRNRAIDFRVNTLPTLFGEKVVLRILDPSAAKIGIEKLGFTEEQENNYLEALKQPHGMVLVTGPTGSGKTVTLYTGLNILNQPGVNISTAEDPAEIYVQGINQVNINPKVGLTFANALRSFLRQDPDIIMVGEIRDLETAEIAVKAAQTGHLVLSTLHTNDAPQTLTRLANMGVAPFNIASSVSLIIAQRLGRRLCDNCKQEDDLPEETLLQQGFSKDELKELQVYKPVGCKICEDGYKGRVGIFQVMPVSEEMGRIIMEGGNSRDLDAQAREEGVKNLREAGLDKVRQGVLGLEELNRVTKD